MCYPQLVFKILAIWKQSSIPAEQGLMFTNAIFQMCLPTFLICYLWWISKGESIFIWVAAKELGIYYSYGSGRFWPCVSNYSDLLPIGLQEAGQWCKYQKVRSQSECSELGAGPSRPLGPALGCCHGNAAGARAGCGRPLSRERRRAERGGAGAGWAHPGLRGRGAPRSAHPSERSRAAGSRRSNFVGWVASGSVEPRRAARRAPSFLPRSLPWAAAVPLAEGACGGRVAAPSPGAARPPARQGLTGARQRGPGESGLLSCRPPQRPEPGGGRLPRAPPGRWEPAVPAAPGRVGGGPPAASRAGC